jgi:L-aspartate oxidase
VSERRGAADVVVVGSGAAGIAAALTAAGHGLRVVMVTKDLTGGASPLAQGGLAAAIGPGDSPGEHARDTMAAGAGLCDAGTVAALASGSPGAVDWLVALGARLERRDLRLEGGHSRRRIVHSGNDASGAEVHRALLAALAASRVEVRTRMIALDLTDEGLLAATIGPGGELSPELITAGAVVLAGGGLGQAFATTSNPAGATGDAIAIAARAGAVLRDVEFVQFHPTVLWSRGATGQRPLVTEALRGAGAVLRDLAGSPVMAGRHPLGDLAPRDIVAAGMFEVMERDGCEHLLLDATGLGRAELEDGFPTVTAACLAGGIDPVGDLIPVAPGAHYACGGIATDLGGHTSVPGLFAVGEAASTGLHGANRLASNSLVEAVIMGRNAAEAIVVARLEGRDWRSGRAWALAQEEDLGRQQAQVVRVRHGDHAVAMPDEVRLGARPASAAGGRAPAVSRAELAAAMSRHAGVVRDADGLRALLRLAATVPPSAAATVAADGPGGGAAWAAAVAGDPRAIRAATGPVAAPVPGMPERAALGLLDRPVLPLSSAGEVEAANLRTVSVLIAAAALARTESRGCHRRRDASQTWARGRHTLMRWTA